MRGAETLKPKGPRGKSLPGATSELGVLLKDWRALRGKSQLSLALDAEVSPRHLAFIESGRAIPSQDMVPSQAGVLMLGLRERNAMLVAAGYAPALSANVSETVRTQQFSVQGDPGRDDESGGERGSGWGDRGGGEGKASSLQRGGQAAHPRGSGPVHEARRGGRTSAP
ncbi:helix-turn-helix transcriptional regulator [Myxococcus stipitatus]|uniref:helix-turn-helix transcriptional regulator n=1 Tax=Myxococcus stipitatus TaxID=83455 RepID=UPI0030D0A0E1